jgi:hypothetical protein
VSSLKQLISRKGDIKEIKNARNRQRKTLPNASGLHDPKNVKHKNVSRKEGGNKEISENSDTNS